MDFLDNKSPINLLSVALITLIGFPLHDEEYQPGSRS
jgi:hypothetical protein